MVVATAAAAGGGVYLIPDRGSVRTKPEHLPGERTCRECQLRGVLERATGLADARNVVRERQLVEDEARFIDFSRSRIFMTEEHEIF